MLTESFMTASCRLIALTHRSVPQVLEGSEMATIYYLIRAVLVKTNNASECKISHLIPKSKSCSFEELSTICDHELIRRTMNGAIIDYLKETPDQAKQRLNSEYLQ